MNSTATADQTHRTEPDLGILPWLPTILSFIAIFMTFVATLALVFVGLAAFGDDETAGVSTAVFYGAAAAWAMLLLGAVATMLIALIRGSRATLIGLMPLGLAASPLCLLRVRCFGAYILYDGRRRSPLHEWTRTL